MVFLARQRFDLLFCAAQSTVNWMLARLTFRRCLSWCVNGFIVYVCVGIIAHKIIVFITAGLVMTHRASNTIVSFIRHHCEVSKFFSAIRTKKRMHRKTKSCLRFKIFYP